MQKSNTMMLVKQDENGQESFGLIAIHLESPFLECRFSLQHKILTVMTKTPLKEFKMLPALDTNGNVKGSKVNKEGIAYTRLEIDSYYSYTITDKKDIQTLVNYLDDSVNDEYLEKYFIPVPEQKTTPSITVPDGVKLEVASKDGKTS